MPGIRNLTHAHREYKSQASATVGGKNESQRETKFDLAIEWPDDGNVAAAVSLIRGARSGMGCAGEVRKQYRSGAGHNIHPNSMD